MKHFMHKIVKNYGTILLQWYNFIKNMVQSCFYKYKMAMCFGLAKQWQTIVEGALSILAIYEEVFPACALCPVKCLLSHLTVFLVLYMRKSLPSLLYTAFNLYIV